MFGKDLQIKKYPYLAYSSNIMEYFAIIGYQEKLIPQIIDAQVRKENNIPPTLISSINSNTDYGIVDNELIITQIYPENPYSIKKEENQSPPQPSNAMYSFCFDSTDGKKKLFYVCYAYKFYEKYKYYITKNDFSEYYIPKAFCIISQYYYFSLFKYICENIYYSTIESKNSKNSLPLEINIYSIVNFIPSPINYRLNLVLFDYELNEKNIELDQLSGYPHLDFDLSEIFNLLPLNLVLEIYILTVVEQSMLFFSSNLELLNMVMFIMYVLNYPCNDSTYFWHIVSVSKDNFVEENKFVGKLMVSLLGVNTTYNENFNTSAFGKYHYIVDIDNKKVYFKQALDLSEDDEIQEYENLEKFQLYIQSIIKEKDKNNNSSIFLKNFVERLKKNLENILTKYQDYNSNPKNKYVNFFKSSKNILEKNKKIQEIFYDFCLNILMIFYQDNSLNSSFDKINKDKIEESEKRIKQIRGVKEDIEMPNEEKYFCFLFRGTIKYKIYFENFIQNLESIDVFKIPLLFSEEFINIKMKDPTNKIINKLSYFNIIDSLYFPQNQQTFNITLNNIYSDYLEKLKKYFKHFFNQQTMKVKNNRQLLSLNKKIINKYIYLLNNFYGSELKVLFPSVIIKENFPLTLIDQRSVSNIIQNIFEQKSLIDLVDYLIYSLVYVFSISLPFHSYEKMVVYIEKLLTSLSKVKLFIRPYIYVIFKTLYKFYLIHKEKQIYPNITVSTVKMYYYMLINVLKNNLILPNDEMMAILKDFFTKIIYQERDSLHNKKDNEDENNSYFKLENGKNFLCFMKHCFTSKKMFKPNTMIKAAMKEYNNCNIIIRGGKKQIQPTVDIKINDYIYSSEFFAPKKIFKLIQQSYNHLFDKCDLDLSQLKIKNVRDVITNLIQYGLELNKSYLLIPVEFLIYTLYFLKDFEKKYEINDNTKKEEN